MLCAFSLLLNITGAFAQSANTEFEAANRLYEQGQFTNAAAGYEKIISAGSAAAPLYFNLGNAFFKAGQVGRAISAYREAELLKPRDPDVQANLRFARNQVTGPTRRDPALARGLGRISLREWTGMAAGAVWITFLLLAAMQLWPDRKYSFRLYAFLVGGAALVLCAGTGFSLVEIRGAKIAIITSREVGVHNGPFNESPVAFTVNDGAELRILDQKDDWLQLTDGTRRIGWVSRDRVVVPRM